MASEQVNEVSETSSTRSSLTLVDAPDTYAETAADEAMDSSLLLSFDDKSTTVLATTPGAAGESPSTVAASPAVQDQTQATETKPADDDTVMTDDDLPLTIDKKVLSALEHQSRAGTDQQDVEEVIGNIINRLQAAIQPSSVNEQTGIQMELVMETFFIKMVNYTKKFDDPAYQSEIGFDRSITAYPAPKGSCTLYDALARNFDQQVLEESKLWRYTAIQELPPILHVLIQRSSVGHKNENPVIIPETLYLDRYMDAPHESPEFKRRNAQWAVASRVGDLKEVKETITAPEPKRVKLDCHAEESELTDIAAFDVSFDVDGPLDSDLTDAARNVDQSFEEPASTEDQVTIESKLELESHIWDLMQGELEKREKQLVEELDELKNYPFRLQAVICHSGRLTSGHYWVWIHDFEDNIWRKYNDEHVEENPNTEAVLKQLSQSGNPYYLCYVRDEDKNDFVNVPKRAPPSPPVDEQPVDEPSEADNDGDVAVLDLVEDTKGQAMVDYEESMKLSEGLI